MATKQVSMLTTEDNPFDPFDQWDAWYQWDASHGYHTPGLLSRITVTSTELSDVVQTEDIESAMDEIVDLDVFGPYKKITRDVERAS